MCMRRTTASTAISTGSGFHAVSAELARRPRQLVGSERRRRLEWRPPGCRQPGQRPVVRAYRLGGRRGNCRRPAPGPQLDRRRRPTPTRVLDARQRHGQHTGPADRASARVARADRTASCRGLIACARGEACVAAATFGVRRAGVTFGIALACALSVPAAATGRSTSTRGADRRPSSTAARPRPTTTTRSPSCPARLLGTPSVVEAWV